MTNSAQMPDSSSPVNYSGTQINFWGCAPNVDPGNWVKQAQGQNQVGNQMGAYGNPYGSQLGAMTNKMINVGVLPLSTKIRIFVYFCIF